MNVKFSVIGKQLAIVALTVASTLLGLYIFFKLSVFFAPFVIAFLLSSMMEPLIRFLTKKVHIKRKPAAIISLLLLLTTLGLLITLIIMKITTEAKSLYNMLTHDNTISENIYKIFGKAQSFYIWLPDEVSAVLASAFNELSDILKDFLNVLAKNAVLTAISLPQMLIFILVTILSTYFFASDRALISTFFNKHLPAVFINKFKEIKNDMFSALFGYIRAQLIIMTITFTELSIGFTIIGIGQPILLALLISLVDALPILGTGGILIPWAIYCAITGQLRLAVSLVIIYVIVLVVRQLIEPKILGQQIGIHPLLTLLAMYTGLKLFGVLGLILGPICALLVINILKGIYRSKSLKEILHIKQEE
mgnify:FL=1